MQNSVKFCKHADSCITRFVNTNCFKMKLLFYYTFTITIILNHKDSPCGHSRPIQRRSPCCRMPVMPPGESRTPKQQSHAPSAWSCSLFPCFLRSHSPSPASATWPSAASTFNSFCWFLNVSSACSTSKFNGLELVTSFQPLLLVSTASWSSCLFFFNSLKGSTSFLLLLVLLLLF